VTISLKISAGPSKTLTLQSTAEGHTATAQVAGADGKSLTFERLHYTCQLPPGPSFCPASGFTSGHGSYSMKFTAPPKTTVTVSGTAGPVSLKSPKKLKTSSGTVPPYTIKQLVKILPKAGQTAGTAANVPPVSSVSASTGETIDMISLATGKRGSTQPVTVTFSQASSTAIDVSGQAKGGKISHATIKSASGKPIKLTLPRYVCVLPPYPTFCPASSAKLSSGRYTVVFNTAPGRPAPSIQAKVEAG
jgi:hypothetical protein